MMSTQFARFAHLSTTRLALNVSKSNLLKLRKKTGYPFGNCKKALEVNNNDLEKAVKWLEDQAKALGWSKAMKMESRNTHQGLVGIAWDKQHAAMVEVNCETDFVSKNDKFQRLVDLAAKTCLQHMKGGSPSPKSICKILLDSEELGNLLTPDKESLSDHIIKGIAMMGEKLVLRRAALISAQLPVHLSALTHPASSSNYSTLFGKYGTVLMYTAASHNDKASHLAKQICQHVIGMNPTQIEAPPDEPPVIKKEKSQLEREEKPQLEREEKPQVEREEKPQVEREEKPQMERGEEGEEDHQVDYQVDSGDDEETVMMRQSFLLDSERTVADVLAEGSVKVEDFIRFECGEAAVESEEVATKVAQAGG